MSQSANHTNDGPERQNPGKRRALIIASYDYPEDPALHRLVAPPRDADDLARVLGDPAIGGFEVEVLLNKPFSAVSEKIDDFFFECHSNDLALLYFSGHGLKDVDGQLYFAMSNTNLKKLPSTAVEAQWLNKRMLRSRARQKILLLDCCLSGAFLKGTVFKSDASIGTQEYFDERGCAILTACDSIQYALEVEGNSVEGSGTRSVFTRTITDGLESGDADLDRDGIITVDEVYEFVLDRMRREVPTQEPRRWALDVLGKIAIAYNPQLAVKAPKLKMPILAILGAKGGVGKSTISCRMAEMIAETGENVLLIDLDTGAAGSTSLLRERGYIGGNSSSVYEVLSILANKPDTSPPQIRIQEITPDYMTEQQRPGRAFLLPAVPLHKISRAPTIDLLQRIIPIGNDADIISFEAVAKVMDHIMASIEAAPVQIGCVIIDCGAEGPEFNPLVLEAHRRATLTYIVVQPDPVSRDNLSHVTHLLTRGLNTSTSEKLRVIINRVFSTQHEAVVKSQFSDHTVVGFIPHNQQLFEDIQKGRVTYRYGYDSISRAIRDILAFGHELPSSIVPAEGNLWADPTARAIRELPVLPVLRKAVLRVAISAVAIIIVGLSLLLYGGPGFRHLVVDIQGIDEALRSEITRLKVFYLLTALLGAGMLYNSVSSLLRWRKRIVLFMNLRSLVKTPPESRSLEEYLAIIGKDKLYSDELEWLRSTIIQVRKH